MRTGLLPSLNLSKPASASTTVPRLTGASVTGTVTVDVTPYDSCITINAPRASQIKG